MGSRVWNAINTCDDGAIPTHVGHHIYHKHTICLGVGNNRKVLKSAFLLILLLSSNRLFLKLLVHCCVLLPPLPWYAQRGWCCCWSWSCSFSTTFHNTLRYLHYLHFAWFNRIIISFSWTWRLLPPNLPPGPHIDSHPLCSVNYILPWVIQVDTC